MKIGLVVALEKESVRVLESLGEKTGEDITFGYKVRKYSAGGNEIFFVTDCLGEIRAAMAATTLILKYGVDLILNFGLVGALNPALKCGDVVAVESVVHYDFTRSMADEAFCGVYGPPTASGTPPYSKGEYFGVESGEFAKFVKDLKKAKLASGDKFIDVSSEKERLVRLFNADICDMEGAGISMAAQKGGIPLIMIKAVSDSADETAETNFNFAIENGVHYYKDAVKKILGV